MFSNPEQNILQLGLREGMKVADFGAGNGAYSLAASKRVGHTGHVYAIEVQKDLVRKLESEIKELHISNIECIWGNIEKMHGSKIADSSMDMIIISNVLFQAEDKIGLIDEAKRILKKGGKVLVIDWLVSSDGVGPAQSQSIKEEVLNNLFLKRGYKFLEKISTSSHHYGIIFTHE